MSCMHVCARVYVHVCLCCCFNPLHKKKAIWKLVYFMLFSCQVKKKRVEFGRDRGGVIPVCMKEREFLWREMKGHHELPFENERCEMKNKGIIFVPQELWV